MPLPAPELDELLVGAVGEVPQAAARLAAARTVPCDKKKQERSALLKRAVLLILVNRFMLFVVTHILRNRRMQLRDFLDAAADEVHVNPPYYFRRRNHVHAPGQPADDVHAELRRPILLVAIAKRQCPRLPAAAVRAATKRTDGVDELVMRYTVKCGGAIASHDYARAVARRARLAYRSAAARCMSRLTGLMTPCAWYIRRTSWRRVVRPLKSTTPRSEG